MKVFLSWSGDLSQKVALALSDWLPQVIQAIEPFVSSENIDKGTRWSRVISRELESTAVGIFCVTPENIGSPWLNFEAGAISKLIDESRVMPFLIGLKRSQVTWPLADFQLTIYDKADMRRMLGSISRASTPPCIEDVKLSRAFDRWWPDLQQGLDPLVQEALNPDNNVDQIPPLPHDLILEELLTLAREQHRILVNRDLEQGASLRGIPWPTARRFLEGTEILNTVISTMPPEMFKQYPELPGVMRRFMELGRYITHAREMDIRRFVVDFTSVDTIPADQLVRVLPNEEEVPEGRSVSASLPDPID